MRPRLTARGDTGYAPGMTLNEWVERYGNGGITMLHRRSGVAVSTIREVLAGRTVKRVTTARKLSEATGGEVTIQTLLGLDAPSQT
jgi:heme A synthase